VIDPRLHLFLRSGAGLVVLAGLLWWFWSSGRVRAARLFGPGAADLRTLAVITWTCAVVTLAAMVLGVFGALHPVTWAVLAAAGGLLLRVRGGASWMVGHRVPSAGDDWDPGPSRIFGAGVAALVLGRLVYGLRNPPADVDSILYHMPMAAHWMATGGLGAETLARRMLAPMSDTLQTLDCRPVTFACSCSRARAAATLEMLHEEDLREMILEDNQAQITCNFCGEQYIFSEGELEIDWQQRVFPNEYCTLIDETNPKRAVLMHLKDKADGVANRFDENVPRTAFKEVGSGILDLKRIVRTATETGVKHFFVEQDQTPGDPLASLKVSASYLKSFDF